MKSYISDAALDRQLDIAGDTLQPSSGFVESVMDAVAAEAATPAPFPFPWMRALPGIAAASVAVALLAAWLGAGIFMAYRLPASSPVWQQMSAYQTAAATAVLPLVFEAMFVLAALPMVRSFSRSNKTKA